MKISKSTPASTITFRTQDSNTQKAAFQWWDASTKKEMGSQLLSTVAFLKENQSYRYRQAALYARMYGNMSLFSFIGSRVPVRVPVH